MKIIFDLPDDTLCATLNFIHGNENVLNMAIRQAGSEDLYDGSVIVYDKPEEEK